MDTAAIRRIQHSKKCNASFFMQSRQHALGDSMRDKIEFGNGSESVSRGSCSYNAQK